MSKKFLIAVLLAFFLLNTVAYAVTDKVFTAQGVFEKWYKKQVRELEAKNLIEHDLLK